MQSKPRWVEVSENECWGRICKPLVSVKWVDTNKGSKEKISVRSRLVARDFERPDKDRDDLLLTESLPWQRRGFCFPELAQEGLVVIWEICFSWMNALLGTMWGNMLRKRRLLWGGCLPP